jgi:multiple sugar transport system ATP-binding protein
VAEIRFEHVSCRYVGSARPAVAGLELTVSDGEFLVLVGPSGCGKTTSLRLLAGLEQASAGRILMGGEDVSRRSPSKRDIAMVFQSYALYPNMTVAQNIEFPLKVAGIGKAERRDRARKVAAMLELSDYMDRKPKALSGGQRQRVAMGRAIVRRPQAFLLDEPLSNLDAKLRVETRTQIAALQRELGVTTVYVTHDQVEAMTMGDRVAVMREGVLQQCDRPQEIYLRPANTFVAGFIGSPPMNLIHARVTDEGADLGAYTVPIPRETITTLNGDREIVVGLRPDAFTVTGSEGLPVRIGVIEIIGSEAYAYGSTRISGSETQIVLRVDPLRPPERGATIIARPDEQHVHIFNPTSQQRLSSGDPSLPRLAAD